MTEIVRSTQAKRPVCRFLLARLYGLDYGPASSITIEDANTSSTWEDPIAYVDETPHDEEYDNLRDENADDECCNLGIWAGWVKEVVDCSDEDVSYDSKGWFMR